MADRLVSVDENHMFPAPLETRLEQKIDDAWERNSVLVAYSLVYGAQPSPLTLATVRGAPAYGTPAKFGWAQSGGVTRAVGAVPDNPTLTLDGWFRQQALPTTNAVDIVWSIGGFMYIAVEPTTGFLSYVHGGSNKRISAINVCDGLFHHVAVELARSGTTVTLAGFWIDGVPVNGAAVSGGITGWNPDLTLGGNPGSGFDLFGSIDSVRVSDASIFPAAGFTPPTAQPEATAHTRFAATLDSADAVSYHPGYPSRPSTAAAGAVTYTGPTQPTDWQTNDRWVKTP